VPIELILVGLIVVGLAFAFGRALVRMGWLGRTDRRVSSGVATWLAEIDHMLNPQRPSVEDIQRARDEDGDEDDDDGEPPDPDQASISKST
jgi:hypothetical protein